jgi:hypothetical protein
LRPGDTPVDIDELHGGFFAKVNQVPGGRHVITGALAGVAAGVFSTATAVFMHAYPEGYGDKHIKDSVLEKRPKIHTAVDVFGWPRVIIPIALTVAVCVLALAMSLNRRRRAWWYFGAVMGALSALQGNPLFFLVAGYLGYGAYKSSKVEGPRSRLLRGADDGGDEAVETSGDEVADDPRFDPEGDDEA